MTEIMPDIEIPDVQLLTGMLDTMSDHVFLLRVEGPRYRLVYCNDALSRFLNRSPSELQGQYLDDFIPDPVLYERTTENYQRALAARRGIRYEESVQNLPHVPSTIFDTRVSPLWGTDRATRYICGICRAGHRAPTWADCGPADQSRRSGAL